MWSTGSVEQHTITETSRLANARAKIMVRLILLVWLIMLLCTLVKKTTRRERTMESARNWKKLGARDRLLTGLYRLLCIIMNHHIQHTHFPLQLIEMNSQNIKVIVRVQTKPGWEQRNSVRNERGLPCSTYYCEGSQTKSILSEAVDTMSKDTVMLVVVNWTDSLDILFRQSEDMLRESKSLNEGGLINFIAASIAAEEGEASLCIKIVDAITQMNPLQDLAILDKEGFLHLSSMAELIQVFSFLSEKLSKSTLVVSLKGSSKQYRITHYPLQRKQAAYEYCYNIELPSNNKHSKYCFLFNIPESALPEVNQLVAALQQSRDNPAAIEQAKREMQRLEESYKRQNEKHKKILTILSKCIDLQNVQIEKKPSLYVQYMAVPQKPNDKLKISAIRKSENEQLIERLQKEVNGLEMQISSIKEQHKQKMTMNQAKLAQKLEYKNKLWSVYQTYTNPKLKIDHINNHNLYWKPPPCRAERETDQDCISPTLTCLTKNNISSYKNITKPNIESKPKEKKKTINFKPQEEPITQSSYNKKDMVKQQQAKLEVKALFTLISQQEARIQQVFKEHSHMLANSTINQIKSRKQKLRVDPGIIEECLRSEFGQSEYERWMRQESNFERFQKELRQKQLAQTITTIRQI